MLEATRYLLLNSHPWLPSAQETKSDLHGQTIEAFMVWPLLTWLISTPSPIHTRLQNTPRTSSLCPS